MGYRAARRVQILLMVWITITFVTAWLPFLRSLMDGTSYEWGDALFGMRFSGAGLEGDFWYPALATAIGLAFLWAGWRRPNGAVRIALPAWLALMLADTLYSVTTAPGDFRFRGDTLGVDVSLAVVAPVLDGAMLALAGWWALRAPALPVPPLERANFVLVTLAALLLPVQFALLSAGRGQDANDVIGVLLTIAGWFVLSAGLGLWRVPRRRPVGWAPAT